MSQQSQELVHIEESAGITFECPKCGKVQYRTTPNPRVAGVQCQTPSCQHYLSINDLLYYALQEIQRIKGVMVLQSQTNQQSIKEAVREVLKDIGDESSFEEVSEKWLLCPKCKYTGLAICEYCENCEDCCVCSEEEHDE